MEIPTPITIAKIEKGAKILYRNFFITSSILDENKLFTILNIQTENETYDIKEILCVN